MYITLFFLVVCFAYTFKGDYWYISSFEKEEEEGESFKFGAVRKFRNAAACRVLLDLISLGRICDQAASMMVEPTWPKPARPRTFLYAFDLMHPWSSRSAQSYVCVRVCVCVCVCCVCVYVSRSGGISVNSEHLYFPPVKSVIKPIQPTKSSLIKSNLM